MKKLILLAILLLLGIFVGTSFALPVLPAGSIYDTYLHPNDNESRLFRFNSKPTLTGRFESHI